MNTTVIAMGTVVPMSKVEGSWICYQVYVIQHYHDNVLKSTRACALLVGSKVTDRFNGYFLSVQMANLSATGSGSELEES